MVKIIVFLVLLILTSCEAKQLSFQANHVFEYVGAGYCRACDANSGCKVNGFRKSQSFSQSSECQAACLSNDECIGFAISLSQCYIYGGSDLIAPDSSWEDFVWENHVITTSKWQSGVDCYRKSLDCCNSIIISFPTNVHSALDGKFVKVQGEFQDGLPVYRNEEDYYLYYAASGQDWSIGPDSTFRNVQSANNKKDCPNTFSSWQYWVNSEWSDVEGASVDCETDLLDQVPGYDFVGFGGCKSGTGDSMVKTNKWTHHEMPECRERCDEKSDCLGFGRYEEGGNTCVIYTYGAKPSCCVVGWNDWVLKQYSNDIHSSITGSTGGPSLCYRKHAPTPKPTSFPTTPIPTSLPTITPSILPTASIPTNLPTITPSNVPTITPSQVPTISPTPLPTTSQPTTEPSTSDPSSFPSFAPTTSDPSLVPTYTPTTSRPTESPTWPVGASQVNVVFDNEYVELINGFGDVEAFLADCTIAASLISIGEVVCDTVFSVGAGRTAVGFIAGFTDVHAVSDWVSEHGLIITGDIMLYPEGWYATSTTVSPTGVPTITETQIPLVCEENENLVTIDTSVGTWYDATISQRWTLSESCEHMSGYMDSDSGFTTHTKTCCLPEGTFTLTCYSGPTFGWMGGSVKVNGVEYCKIDNANREESYEVNLCTGASNCGEPPADFYELTDECDLGFVPQISMAIGTSSSSSTEAMSWKLTDACQGGNYPALPSFGNHEYHPEDCCLPKGKYTLTCSATGVFTWQDSFILVNGRQYCFGSDGGESHVIDMCSGADPCPDFTTNEVGSTFQPQIQIGGADITISSEEITLSGEIEDGEQHNDSCFFANNDECDVGGYFPLCNEGTDCTDCDDCNMIYTGSSSAGALTLYAALFFTIILM